MVRSAINERVWADSCGHEELSQSGQVLSSGEKCLGISQLAPAMAQMPYENDVYDTFAAQLASPLFNGLCASGWPAGAREAASDSFAASAACSLLSPASSDSSEVVIHFNNNRQFRCSRRVIFSSSSSCESQERVLDKSVWDDECGICGGQEGDLLCCEGGDGCTTVCHQYCLG